MAQNLQMVVVAGVYADSIRPMLLVKSIHHCSWLLCIV